ncbi:hypothetical protein LXL04_036628 [Taraxacum kok-saghyz]
MDQNVIIQSKGAGRVCSSITILSSELASTTPMATSTPLFSLSHLNHKQTTSKRLLLNPNCKAKIIRILCSSSSSFPQSTITHETITPLPPNNSVNNVTPQNKWEAHRKRKVLMRVGYAGINTGSKRYQFLKVLFCYIALEKELETAIYNAGGIRDSNFGDLQKIAWATSSQFDDEIHSLSTMISLKMEIPEYAWINDPNGTLLADTVNTYLPKNIRVFSILPSQKGFDAKKECNMRKYGYLLPLELIGINSNFTKSEVEHHLSEFNDILSIFEGKHPFHNYTTNQRKNHLTKQSGEEMVTQCLDEDDMNSNKELIDEYDANENSVKLNNPVIFDKWVHEPDDNDRITDFHFRRILHFSCGKPKHLLGASYVEISICGESFMLHQIRKMVATAVAVKRGLLPKDIIPLSLNKFTRFLLPVVPSDILYLRFNHFILEKEFGKTIRPEIMTSVESENILKDVEEFYDSIMLPRFLEFLDPMKSPWKEWVEVLDANIKIPDSQLDEVRNAWNEWDENTWLNS